MKGKGDKGLREGFTTGTAAAAAAKAAVIALVSGNLPGEVSVTLPRGGELSVKIKSVIVEGGVAIATVVKDGGDDPDVTNKAEIVAAVGFEPGGELTIEVDGGEGVGRVTRPGLAVSPGRAAINPVPMEMITASVKEAAVAAGAFKVTVSVPLGVELAEKTMNGRLGIVGGISILGTTGIVVPLSTDAYKDSIVCALDVAVAAGLTEVVLSTGRSSEKAVEDSFNLPEAAFILTGDHMGYALTEAAKRKELKKATLAGQFGKVTKIAAGHMDTHCTKSKVEFEFIAEVLREAGAGEEVVKCALKANTAREIFFIIKEKGLGEAFEDFASLVKKAATGVATGMEVSVFLVGYEKEIVVKV